jgi:hypothetical protein
MASKGFVLLNVRNAKKNRRGNLGVTPVLSKDEHLSLVEHYILSEIVLVFDKEVSFKKD